MQTLVQQAVENARINKTDVGTELNKLENELRVKREIQESKSQSGRQAAEKAAKTTVQEGVKKTTYPYVAPSRGGGGGGGGVPGIDEMLAKGGKVKGYASGGKVRGGGCERQGKTKGRFV